MLLIFLFRALVEKTFDGEVDDWTTTVRVTLTAIMSLMLWLKFLYFLRIFKATSYLIRIIIEVVIDMKYFLAVLLLTFIAFGDAIFYINQANSAEVASDEGGRFIGGEGYAYSIIYVYRMVLGDFATD
jgi:hypothetical protein